jgi:histone deacetylase HOS3
MGSLLDPQVKMVHGSQDGKVGWAEELGVLCKEADDKLRTGECEVPDKFHQGDLYLCGESKEDIEGCIGAMYDGVDAIFAEPEVGGPVPARRAFVCIRPPGKFALPYNEVAFKRLMDRYRTSLCG